MRVAFFTGSLEPDRDGVGDYTRWLAVEASRRGVSCRLVALADRHVDRPSTNDDGSNLPTLRLPFSMSWPSRLNAARAFLESSSPDWVSLQFVPYSFQRWGLTASLVGALPELVGRARLHVMLHEIWIEGRESWRRHLVSQLQRRSILDLCRYPGAVVHTSNVTYRQVLRDDGVHAGLLPLFGSVPIASSDASSWLAPALDEAGCDALSNRRDAWWLLAFFGALYPIWPPEPLLSHLEAAAVAAGRRVALVAIGRMAPGEKLWADMAARYASRIPMLCLGAQPAQRVSELLNTVDFGIATTPLALIGKSATAAAMFDHGLPVVVNREDGGWHAPPTVDARESALVVRMGADFAERLQHVRRRPPAWRLPEIADRWCDELSRMTARVA